MTIPDTPEDQSSAPYFPSHSQPRGVNGALWSAEDLTDLLEPAVIEDMDINWDMGQPVKTQTRSINGPDRDNGSGLSPSFLLNGELPHGAVRGVKQDVPDPLLRVAEGPVRSTGIGDKNRHVNIPNIIRPTPLPALGSPGGRVPVSHRTVGIKGSGGQPITPPRVGTVSHETARSHMSSAASITSPFVPRAADARRSTFAEDGVGSGTRSERRDDRLNGRGAGIGLMSEEETVARSYGTLLRALSEERRRREELEDALAKTEVRLGCPLTATESVTHVCYLLCN